MLRKIVKSGLVGLLSLAPACIIEPYSYYDNNRNKTQNKYFAIDSFFACNDYKDLDGNGHIKISEEIFGIKNNFSTNESIRFVADIDNCKGRPLVFRLYDNSGFLMYEEREPVTYVYNLRFSDYPHTVGLNAPGEYTGKWFLNGRHLGETKINVFQEEKKNKPFFRRASQDEKK